jgi:methyl coenzyme M reductase subunit C
VISAIALASLGNVAKNVVTTFQEILTVSEIQWIIVVSVAAKMSDVAKDTTKP